MQAAVPLRAFAFTPGPDCKIEGGADISHFSKEKKMTNQPSQEGVLDVNHILTGPVWTYEELDVKITHRPPSGVLDKAAYATVQAMRLGFDIGSLYFFKSRGLGSMSESDWLRRLVFLETVAGVPGMVGGMIRHLHSLRLMRRDHGWIHSLLAEAENERMHLLIVLQLRKPGLLFRAAVIATQSVFFPTFALAYLASPNFCHRFVGYLEEEAVKTYTHLLHDIDDGKLPLFTRQPAPMFARTYYNLPEGALLRDVFASMRADESHHRDANHHFGSLRPDEPNEFHEHLRRHGQS